MTYDKILILDLDSSLTRVLAHCIRAAYVYCEIHPAHVGDAWLRQYAAEAAGTLKGIILSGDAGEADAQTVASAVFDLGVPVLGIDEGMRVMARRLGGSVQTRPAAALGPTRVRARGHTRLLLGIEDYQAPEGHGMLDAWMHQGSQVNALPPGFERMASSADCAIAGMADQARRFYGVQFHPEVAATRQGMSILTRFVLDICSASPNWVIGDHVEEAVTAIREQVGDQQVLLGLSGGVDSSVCAALIHRAIGDQLTCVFVDHGLLRLNEAQQVMALVADKLNVRVIHVDASAQFLSQLEGISDPEQKRSIIGREFIDVFKSQAAKLMDSDGSRGRIRFLAQGTIYPDIIESGSKGKVAVKSHHNVGGLPEQLGLTLLEPLRDLFKDEVRQLGLALGLPREMVYRHPFPGPGLGVRILGEVKAEYADMLRAADAIFVEELRDTSVDGINQSWYEAVAQAFAVFLPIKSVGTTGSARTYEYAVALRAVQTTDFMTAEWADLPADLLRRISARIITEVDGINRVTYDISSKPPATIEWE